MSTAEIAQLESAGRAAMVYSPENLQDRYFTTGSFVASLGWITAFVAVIGVLFFALS